jgi:hypothetical protein
LKINDPPILPKLRRAPMRGTQELLPQAESGFLVLEA